ncbi:hypothetical protein LCGC14_3022600, partial [marine sediment metagenome]
TYASIIFDEIEAKSLKEAKKIADQRASKGEYEDPSVAEMQEILIDEPVLQEQDD